jgi:hypothetical protein
MAVSTLTNPTRNAPPAYSIRSRLEPVDPNRSNPGPGAYAIDRGLRRNMGKFGNEHRDAYYRKFETPGPGKYLSDSVDVKMQAPKWSLRSRSEAGIDSTLPGPGSYTPIGGLGMKPGYTIRGRPKDNYSAVPGPGSYGTPSP